MKYALILFYSLSLAFVSYSQKKSLFECPIADEIIDINEAKKQDYIINVIKNVDPKLATNFLNTEIKSFDDLSKHLINYKVLWKSMCVNWPWVNDAVLSFKTWADTGYLKTVDETKFWQLSLVYPLKEI